MIHATSGPHVGVARPSRRIPNGVVITHDEDLDVGVRSRSTPGLEEARPRLGHENPHGVQRIVRPVSRGPGGDPIEFGFYLPQVGFSWEQIRERALVAEEVGFGSVWFMDHLYPPELPDVRVVRGVDRGDGRGDGDDAPSGRAPRALEHVAPPRVAREDGDDARRDLRRPPRPRHRQRLVPARARPRRYPVGLDPRPLRAARGGARDRDRDVHGHADVVRGAPLPRRRPPERATAGAATAPADPRRRRRRAPHAAAGRALRRRLELPDVRAG